MLQPETLYEFIFKRRSVRKYQPEPLGEDQLKGIVETMSEVRPLVPDIGVDTRLLDARTVKGMFRTDAPHYLAFLSERKDRHSMNAGFMLQQLDLHLSSIGIGCCYQAGAKAGKDFEAPGGLENVIMISFGRPKGDMHRSSASEFKRKPLAKISDVEGNENIVEAARLAPSGMNGQPWFFTGGGDVIHAHCARSLIGGEMNRIDMGIALCHVWLAAAHEGLTADFVNDAAGSKSAPRGYDYVCSVRLGR